MTRGAQLLSSRTGAAFAMGVWRPSIPRPRGSPPAGGSHPSQHPPSTLLPAPCRIWDCGHCHGESAGAGGSQGTGCGRSRPASKAGMGGESLPAFPAGVGLPQPPSIPLHSPVTAGSTEQPTGMAKPAPLPQMFLPQHTGGSRPCQEPVPISSRLDQAWGRQWWGSMPCTDN